MEPHNPHRILLSSWRRPIHPAHHRRAFTLVELLTVVAIVAILLGLGSSAWRGVMNRSKDAKTVSDLRQMAALASIYAADTGGLTVPGKDADNGQQWQVLLARLHAPGVVTSITDLFSQTAPSPKIRREFSLFAPAFYQIPWNYWDTGYGINMLPSSPGPWVANTGENWGESGKIFRQVEITHPSRRPFIFPWPAWNAYGWDTSWAYERMLSPTGKFHVLFYDGHVSSLNREDREKFQRMLENPAGA